MSRKWSLGLKHSRLFTIQYIYIVTSCCFSVLQLNYKLKCCCHFKSKGDNYRGSKLTSKTRKSVGKSNKRFNTTPYVSQKPQIHDGMVETFILSLSETVSQISTPELRWLQNLFRNQLLSPLFLRACAGISDRRLDM